MVGHRGQTLPVARADGLVEVALRDQVALVIDGDRQLRQGPLRRSEHDLRAVRRRRTSTGGTGTGGGGSAARTARPDNPRGCRSSSRRRSRRRTSSLRSSASVEVGRVEADQQDDGLGLLVQGVLRLVEVLRDDVEHRADGDVGGLDGPAATGPCARLGALASTSCAGTSRRSSRRRCCRSKGRRSRAGTARARRDHRALEHAAAADGRVRCAVLQDLDGGARGSRPSCAARCRSSDFSWSFMSALAQWTAAMPMPSRLSARPRPSSEVRAGRIDSGVVARREREVGDEEADACASTETANRTTTWRSARLVRLRVVVAQAVRGAPGGPGPRTGRAARPARA